VEDQRTASKGGCVVRGRDHFDRKARTFFLVVPSRSGTDLLAIGWFPNVTFVSVGASSTSIKETLAMRIQRKMAAVLGSSLGLFLWGCTGDQVESGADATARGLGKGGGAVESAGKSVGAKLEHTGEGTKFEKVTKATGAAIERGGEKTHELLNKGGEKIKEAAPAVGRAVDKAGEKLKDLETKTVDKLKDAGSKIKEEAKDLGEKAGEKLKDLKEKTGEKLKDLKDKASDALDKSKDKDKEKTPATDKND